MSSYTTQFTTHSSPPAEVALTHLLSVSSMEITITRWRASLRLLVGALRPGLPIHLGVRTVHGSRLLPWRTILLLLLLLWVCILGSIPILGIIAGVPIAARLRLTPLMLLLLLMLMPVWILCAVLGIRDLIWILLGLLIAVASAVGCLASWSSSPGRGGTVCWSGLSAGVVNI